MDQAPKNARKQAVFGGVGRVLHKAEMKFLKQKISENFKKRLTKAKRRDIIIKSPDERVSREPDQKATPKDFEN